MAKEKTEYARPRRSRTSWNSRLEVPPQRQLVAILDQLHPQVVCSQDGADPLAEHRVVFNEDHQSVGHVHLGRRGAQQEPCSSQILQEMRQDDQRSGSVQENQVIRIPSRLAPFGQLVRLKQGLLAEVPV